MSEYPIPTYFNPIYFVSPVTGNLFRCESTWIGLHSIRAVRIGQPETVGDREHTQTGDYSHVDLKTSNLRLIESDDEYFQLMRAWHKTYAVQQVTVPAGTYYMGDPCYAFGVSEEGQKAWRLLLGSCDLFGTQMTGTWGRFTIFASRTFCGDGTFHIEGTDIGLMVDAGVFGLVPESLLGMFPDNDGGWLHKVTFRDDFVFSRDIEKGELTIGQFKIRF